MPKALERKLEKEAKAKGFKPGSDRFDRYVYGSMRKIMGKISGTKKHK